MVLFLPIVKRIEKYNLTNASMIVVVSEVSKKQLLKRGIPESKILINPNGVDTEQYNPGISGDPVRVLYSIKKTQTVFGFIGTFGQWHGVLEMAQAIVLFYTKYKGKHVKFLLIGNGVLFEQTKKIISKAGLNKHVIFTGQIPQDQGPIHLAACDILLSPHIPNPDGTEFFGSPTKLFEYMAMGKAIIASDLNQIGLVLKHQETAILVNPGDIEELSQSMLSILNNQEQILNLGTNARLKALKEHSWDKHVIRILERINND
jgi:glycosyltransferase involved in cell wall biosynthesis